MEKWYRLVRFSECLAEAVGADSTVVREEQRLLLLVARERYRVTLADDGVFHVEVVYKSDLRRPNFPYMVYEHLCSVWRSDDNESEDLIRTLKIHIMEHKLRRRERP